MTHTQLRKTLVSRVRKTGTRESARCGDLPVSTLSQLINHPIEWSLSQAAKIATGTGCKLIFAIEEQTDFASIMTGKRHSTRTKPRTEIAREIKGGAK